MSKKRYTVSDELWEKIRPWLPARENSHPRNGGRKPKDDRTVFNAILFVLHTGSQWNALSATGICPSTTAHRRFQLWTKKGVFRRLWEAGLLEEEELRGIDWSWVAEEALWKEPPPAGVKARQPAGRRSVHARRLRAITHRFHREQIELGGEAGD